MLKAPDSTRRACEQHSENLSVDPAGNEYSTLFGAGESEAGEVMECHPILVTLLSVQVGSLTATSPRSFLVRERLHLLDVLLQAFSI